MSLKNEKYKNKLENGRKKKFGKEFAEIPKGKHYVEELEPLIGAAVDLECNDWVFIPGELGGIPCEKLLLKSVKLVKCPVSRGVECPVKISKKIWTAVDADFRKRLGLEGEKEKYKSGIHGRTPIHARGIVYEHKVFVDGIQWQICKEKYWISMLFNVESWRQVGADAGKAGVCLFCKKKKRL